MAKAKKWGPWENVSLIGEGGAGQVFTVRHTETHQTGALKRLKNPNRHKRFKAEVEAVQNLSHPGIVRLLDANLDAEPYYAVYEYEAGGSLADIPTDELLAIPLAQRLELCTQICRALQAAHKASLVHRDIKPDNILISEDRKSVRLCDFGLVFCNEGERQTVTMEQVGSRYYIPPELEDGRADEVSVASDIYSAGKVVYYLMTGAMFARERHREEQYDLTLRLSDPYFESVSRILDQTITVDPSDRLDSAGRMAELIEEATVTLSNRHPIPGKEDTYRCIFCGVGKYQKVAISGDSEAHNAGYAEGNIGYSHMVFMECDNCGNSQRFKLAIGGEKWFPEAKMELNKRLSR